MYALLPNGMSVATRPRIFVSVRADQRQLTSRMLSTVAVQETSTFISQQARSFADASLTYPRAAALSCLSSVTLSLFYPSTSTLLPILPIFSEITRVIHQHAAETRLKSYCLPQSLTVIHHHTEIETVCLHT